MLYFKKEIIRVHFLLSNEDSVREMTIGHPPQRKERDPKTPQLPQDFKPSGLMLQGALFIFLFTLFSVSEHYPSLFLSKPQI